MDKINCRIEIVEILASRICHDLISPVGAINNGVEFMKDMGEDAGDDAIDLIEYSAKQAAARLQIFRLAYGAGGRDADIKAENVYSAFDKLLSADRKIKQNWNPLSEEFTSDIPEGWCKILTNAMMMAVECLPRGGEISIKKNEAITIITAKGENAAIRDYTEEALENLLPVSDINPRLVHPYISGLLAKEYGYEIDIKENGGNIDISIKK